MANKKLAELIAGKNRIVVQCRTHEGSVHSTHIFVNNGVIVPFSDWAHDMDDMDDLQETMDTLDRYIDVSAKYCDNLYTDYSIFMQL